MRQFRSAILAIGLGAFASSLQAKPHALPNKAAIDAFVGRALQGTGTKSLALAVIDGGRVSYVKAYGVRTAKGDPLAINSIMYGASLTKAVFAYLVLQLAQEQVIELDTPISKYLPQPLSAYGDADSARRYGNFADIAGDPRWSKLTPRILLTHSSGLANFPAMEPDGKQRLHFEPGSRYAYSGSGLLLLQLVLEKGLGLNVADELNRRVFEPLAMRDTSLTWRDDFAGREATGWTLDGKAPGHAHQSKVRVAGSMDTTIGDMAKFAAALVRGDQLTPAFRRELTRPQLAITSATQFPTLQPEAPLAQRTKNLAVGAVVITFRGPQGAGFMKGGHNDLTGNTMVCLERSKRCVVLLGADVRAEATFPAIVKFILGETGCPWAWEYGAMRFWSPKV